jgi:multiple sugar transport system substrate-binding protein
MSDPRTVRLRVVLATLVAALALGSAGAQVTTIAFARLSSQAHNAYLDPIIAAFEEAHPDIRVVGVESAGDGYEGLAQTALLGLAAGRPPDVVQVGFTFLDTLVASGGPVPLDEFMEADPEFDASAMVSAMLALGQLDGATYIVPIGVSTPIMYYNVDLFREVGLDPDAPPRTWAEAAEAAQVLHDAGYEGILWGWSITGNWIFQTMLENAGGRLGEATPDGYRVTFNDEAGVEVLTYLHGLTSTGLMPVTEDLVQTFTSGRLGMFVDSSFQRVNTPAGTNAEVRLAPIPTPDGGPAISPAGGNGVMMFARDPVQQEAAWTFLRFLTGPEASRLVAENSGYTPPNAEGIEALKAANADDPDYQIVLEQVDHIVPWHAWPGPNGPRIVQVIKDMQHAVMLGRIDPDRALDEAADEVTRLVR